MVLQQIGGQREGIRVAGRIKQMIDGILARRAKDNEMLARVIKTKLILKGINPAKYSAQSHDDPAIIAKLEKMAHDLCQ